MKINSRDSEVHLNTTGQNILTIIPLGKKIKDRLLTGTLNVPCATIPLRRVSKGACTLANVISLFLKHVNVFKAYSGHVIKLDIM